MSRLTITDTVMVGFSSQFGGGDGVDSKRVPPTPTPQQLACVVPRGVAVAVLLLHNTLPHDSMTTFRIRKAYVEDAPHRLMEFQTFWRIRDQ